LLGRKAVLFLFRLTLAQLAQLMLSELANGNCHWSYSQQQLLEASGQYLTTISHNNISQPSFEPQVTTSLIMAAPVSQTWCSLDHTLPSLRLIQSLEAHSTAD